MVIWMKNSDSGGHDVDVIDVDTTHHGHVRVLRRGPDRLTKAVPFQKEKHTDRDEQRHQETNDARLAKRQMLGELNRPSGIRDGPEVGGKNCLDDMDHGQAETKGNEQGGEFRPPDHPVQ